MRTTARKLAAAGTGMLLALFLAPAFGKVEISGLDGEPETNVSNYLALGREPCDSPEWKVRRLFAAADRQISEALEVFGFYRPVIDKQLTFGADCWTATFTIDPGVPVKIRSVDVRIEGPGSTLPEFNKLLAQNPLRVGEPLDHARYKRIKQNIADLGRRLGYFDGRFSARTMAIDPQAGTADIELIYITGERYRFGEVVIEQDVIHPELIERFINFEPGMPYDAREVTALYEALIISGYFDGVDIRTIPEAEPDRTVRVTIRGTESRARTFTGGIGFGTDTGPKLRAGFSNRRLNRAGHQFNVDGNTSQVISEIGMRYRLPLENPSAESLNFDAGYKYEDTDTSRSKQAKAGVKRLKLRPNRWLETDFLDIIYEDFRAGADDGTSFLIVPGISLSQTISSRLPRPLRGHRINLQVSGTVEEIGSTATFLQGDLLGKLVRPLWPGGRVLLRGEAGFTVTGDFKDIPASLRYFAGGDVSVRGYEYQTLGPIDESGRVAGGKHLLTGSVELDQRFLERWSMAAFVDAGNAFDDFDDMDLKFSVGAGVRWYSPLGPIRFDIGVPLDSDAEDSFRFHISLGPDL